MNSFLPGQEAGNVDVVLDAGFGAYNKKPYEIAIEVATWLQDETKLVEMSQNSKKVGHAKAAAEIVSDIGDITLSWMELNGERKSVVDSSRTASKL